MSRPLALSVVVCLQVLSVGLHSAHAQLLGDVFNDNAPFGPRAGVHYQTEENGGDRFTDARLFLPFGDEELQFFGDTRLIADRDGELGWNLGLGARGAIGSESMWGANLFADRRRSPFGIYNQIGFGFELVLDGLEIRNNYYHPVGTDRETIFESTTQSLTPGAGDPFFQENFLKAPVTSTFLQLYEQALRGFDLEAGGVIYSDEDIALRAYIGGYYFDNPGLTDAPGISGRLNLIARDNVEVNAFVQHDRFFDTNGGVGLTLYLGGSSNAPNVSEQVRRVMGRPVYRRQMMTLAQGSRVEAEDLGIICLTNPETGNPLTITHVDSNARVYGGDGTFENPFMMLPGTQPTDIVYIYSDSELMGQYTLAAGQRLLGEGNGFVHLVDTVELGTIPLPAGNGAGTKPEISLDGGGFVITMDDNSEVANLSLVQDSQLLGGGGIEADGITGGLIDSVMISTGGDDAYGVLALNSSLQIVDSMISTTGTGAGGLFAVGSSNVSVLDSSIETSGSGARGVFARDTSTVTLENTSIQINGDGGSGVFATESASVNLLNGSSISLGALAGSSAVLTRDSSHVTLDASSITTQANGAHGILATDNSTITVDNSSITTTGSGALGILFDGGNQLTVRNGSTINSFSHALRFLGGAGETNTLTAVDSLFDAGTGGGILVETADAMNTIDASILGNSLPLNSIVLDQGTNGGTLNILGASDAMDLSNKNNSANVNETGTINYVP